MRFVTSRLLAAMPRVTHVVRAFLPRLTPQLPKFFAALGLSGLVALSEVLRPWPLQLVFDHVLVPRPRAANAGPLDALFAGLRGLTPFAIVGWAAIAVLAISVLGGLADYARTIVLSEVGQRLVARLRRDLFRHLLVLPPSYHQSRSQGDLLMRLTGDIVLLRELLVGGMLDAISAALTLAGTLAMMLWLDWRLTLLSLAIVPGIALASSLISERIRTSVKKNRDKEGVLAANAGEALGAIQLLQAFGATDRVGASFERGNRSSLRSGLKSSRLEALLARSLDLLTAAGTAVTLGLGAWSVVHGHMSPGGLLVFLAYQRTLYKPVRQLARLAARAAKSAACGERVLDVLDTPPAIADAPHATAAPDVAGAITLEHVTVRYPRGDLALDDVSLHVPAGAVAVIRGESGAGKSTLLALLPRLLDPTAGAVRVDGVDVRDWTLASLRSRLAVVFQDSVLFGLSLRDNILLGREDATESEVLEAAERAGVLRFANALPHGLDTIVGERGALLSGGPRQRVARARAKLRRAPILVLDEPFAHLDEASRDHVLAALQELRVGRTVVLVTHQDHPGLEPDLTFELAGGRLVRRIDHAAARGEVALAAGAAS